MSMTLTTEVEVQAQTRRESELSAYEVCQRDKKSVTGKPSHTMCYLKLVGKIG